MFPFRKLSVFVTMLRLFLSMMLSKYSHWYIQRRWLRVASQLGVKRGAPTYGPTEHRYCLLQVRSISFCRVWVLLEVEPIDRAFFRSSREGQYTPDTSIGSLVNYGWIHLGPAYRRGS